MYYRVTRSEDCLSHSKGVWKVHKYLRKIGKKYYYYDKNKSNEAAGIRTYAHVRSDDEKDPRNKDYVKQVDYLQEINSDDWFSSLVTNNEAWYSYNSKGEAVANYYSTYRVGKIERFARDNEAKVKNFINSLFGKKV